mmetsp:Transcript_102271/g.176594  ORF Transcript_102271/g.176594 Transcript_102271/m.176594 type:complete len:295 (-) Transcript_102271:171-1055(-)
MQSLKVLPLPVLLQKALLFLAVGGVQAVAPFQHPHKVHTLRDFRDDETCCKSLLVPALPFGAPFLSGGLCGWGWAQRTLALGPHHVPLGLKLAGGDIGGHVLQQQNHRLEGPNLRIIREPQVPRPLWTGLRLEAKRCQQVAGALHRAQAQLKALAGGVQAAVLGHSGRSHDAGQHLPQELHRREQQAVFSVEQALGGGGQTVDGGLLHFRLAGSGLPQPLGPRFALQMVKPRLLLLLRCQLVLHPQGAQAVPQPVQRGVVGEEHRAGSLHPADGGEEPGAPLRLPHFGVKGRAW